MFNFLKKKIQGLLKKTSKEAEKKVEPEVKILKDTEIEQVNLELPAEKQVEIQEKSKKLEKELLKEREEKKLGFFKKLAKGLTIFKLSEPAFNEFFEELEAILIENNVALEAIDALKQKLRQELVGKEMKKKEIEQEIRKALKTSILALLIEPFNLLEKIRSKKEKPFVIVFFGINGSGKTTTIAKLAWLFKKNNLNCVLAASDTFRAASIEQLEKHASKLQIKIIKHKYSADPAAVAFDAIAHAKAHSIDIVLVDTAGRMHTKKDLLKEMEKICRVAKPDLKLLVAEAITGNDAVEQARTFKDAIGIDAIILAKADVDERGGACISMSYITGKPILFLGTGQKYNDLEFFDKKKIVEKIFD